MPHGKSSAWVYGLGIVENGWLQGKTVFVEQGNKNSFVHLNLAVNLICWTPFSSVNYPTCLFYRSSVGHKWVWLCQLIFWLYKKKNFLTHFLKILHLSLQTQTALYILMTTHKLQSTRMLGCDLSQPFTSLSTTLFLEIKLLNKHTRRLWNSQTVRKVSAYYLGLVTHAHKIVTLNDWHEFIRKVTFHASKVTRHHEAKILPSWNALVNHSLRANLRTTTCIQLTFSAVCCTPSLYQLWMD